ncbi:uncharacterized protein FYW23_008037 isoform 2-T3 [Sylvia borin]
MLAVFAVSCCRLAAGAGRTPGAEAARTGPRWGHWCCLCSVRHGASSKKVSIQELQKATGACEECGVKRSVAALCSEEGKEEEEEGGSVSSCLVSSDAVTELKQAEHLAAMLGG